LITVFLLAVTASAHAESGRLHGRHSVHSEKEINPSPQPQTQTREEARGTDKNPVSIKVISTPDAKAENSEERERRVTHEANEQGLTDYTRGLMWATLGLVCVAMIQAGLFVWQLVYMRKGLVDAKVASDAAKDAAKAARESVDIGKTSMISGDRAYVHFAGCRWISHKLEGTERVFWRIRPTWINSGNTPTRKLYVYVYYEILDEPMQVDHAFTPAEHKRVPATIPPKGQIESGPRDFFGDDLIDVKEGKKHLYVWGIATYRDVFPDTADHITKFCVVATNITGNPLEPWDDKSNIFNIAFTNYDRHNCADEDCDENSC
jgi:hypothetical protein